MLKRMALLVCAGHTPAAAGPVLDRLTGAAFRRTTFDGTYLVWRLELENMIILPLIRIARRVIEARSFDHRWFPIATTATLTLLGAAR